jgi:hypothetical protein
MLGHSDIRMILAIYVHCTDDMQDAATDVLEETFRPCLDPAVDTPQKRGSGSTAEALYFLGFCSTF